MNEDLFVAFNLKKIYHELGVHSFKIVLNPQRFKSSHDSSISATDADGKPMEIQVEKWGRKMNCSFNFTSDKPDGVATMNLSLVCSDGSCHDVKINFWMVK